MCRERYTHHWVLKIQKRALRSLDHRQVCYSDEYELNRAIIIQITVLFAKKPRFSDLIITAVIDAINEALVDRLVTALSERNPSFVCDDDKKWLCSEKLDILAGPFEAETTAKAYKYTERKSGVRIVRMAPIGKNIEFGNHYCNTTKYCTVHSSHLIKFGYETETAKMNHSTRSHSSWFN